MRPIFPLTCCIALGLTLGGCEPKTAAKAGSSSAGETDPVSTAVDADGDGHDVPHDCDDSNAQIHPAAIEVCDGVDNNCDGRIDDADPTTEPSTAQTWFYDGDGDGFREGVVWVFCVFKVNTSEFHA